MTTLQKALIAVTLAVVTGAVIFEARKASSLDTELRSLRQQQAELAEQLQQLQRERDEVTRQLIAVRADNERLNANASELLRLRGEVGLLRRNQAAREQTANSSSPQTETSATNGPSPEAIGRELGTAAVRGDPGAFGKLSQLAAAEHTSFTTNNVGLNDSQRGDLARQTFAPLHAAFKVIEEAAADGNQVALDAVVQAMQIPELKGGAVQCIGAIAGKGNDTALEVLLNPRDYGLLPSTVVGALQPAADNGNQKAIDALAAVTRDAGQTALWYMAARGLEKSAGSGNEVAIDALIGLSVNPNPNVQQAVVPGLKAAASNQNAKAAEALRLMGLR